LRRLNLNGAKVTPGGIAALRKALPACAIQSGPDARR
jgi:hypothetical protein